MDQIVLSPSGIIFGLLFLLLSGLIARFARNRMREERESLSKDRWTGRPIAEGTVLERSDSAQRWIVRFVNAEGEECLGMDDRFIESVFHLQRYHMPKRGTVEAVYYWPFDATFDRNRSYCFDGLRAHYWIHFCDERFYEVSHTKQKRRVWGCYLLAAAFLAAGVLTLLFGK